MKSIEEFRFHHTAARISMKKAEDSEDEYETAVISLYDTNNPHKTTALPAKVLEFRNIEKVRLRNMNVSYYLEGNDIIINDNIELFVKVDYDQNKVTLRNYQVSVEERK